MSKKKQAGYRDAIRKRVRMDARAASHVRNDGCASDYEVGQVLAKIQMLPRVRDYQATKLIDAVMGRTKEER